MNTVVPAPGLLASQILPPWHCTVSLQNVSPSPES
jgi:hypothetical protein